jgi:uncharacterized metal-binding protein
MGLEFFYTLSFQKCSIAFCLSLLASRFLMHILSHNNLKLKKCWVQRYSKNSINMALMEQGGAELLDSVYAY